MTEKTKSTSKLFIFIIALAAVSVILSVVFSITTSIKAKNDAFSIVESSLDEQITSLDTELMGRYSTLQAYASIISKRSDFEYDKSRHFQVADEVIFDILETAYESHYFIDILYAGQNGMAYYPNGEMRDIGDRGYYLEGMAGNKGIEKVTGRMTREERFVLSVPIIHDGVVVGVIAGTFNADMFKKVINSRVYDGSAFSFLCDSNGKVLLSVSELGVQANENIFDYLRDAVFYNNACVECIEKDLTTLSKGQFEMENDRGGKLAVYNYSGINDWTLFTVLPIETLNAVINESTKEIYLVSMMMLVLGVAALIFFLMTDFFGKKKLEIEKDELSAAVNQSGRYMLRYEFETGAAYVIGKTRNIFKGMEVIPSFLTFASKEYVVEECVDELKAFFADMLKSETGGCDIRAFSPISKKKCWIHIDYTLVKDRSGFAKTAIVSFFDNTQNKEKEMVFLRWKREIAEKIEKSISFLRANISENRIIESKNLELFNSAGDNYEEMVKYTSKNGYYGEDTEKLKEFFERRRLLNLFSNGVTKDYIEFKVKIDSVMTCFSASIEMMKNKNETEVNAYIIFNYLDKERVRLEELTLQANLDSLTNIYNRVALEDKINESLYDADEKGLYAFFMVDLDNFKKINDEKGHIVGDKVLRTIAESLVGFVRSKGLIGRIGGDEFVCFFSNIQSRDEIENIAHNLIEVLQFDVENISVSASIGISISEGGKKSFEELYSEADAALYAIKRQGKCGYGFSDKKAAKQSGAFAPVQLRTILNNLDSGVALIDVDAEHKELDVVYINKGLAKIIEKDCEKLSGARADFLSSIADDDAEIVKKALFNVAVSGESAELVYHLNCESRKVVRLRILKNTETSSSGRLSVIAVVTDITYLAKMDEKYRVADNLISIGLELTGFTMFEVDIDSRIFYIKEQEGNDGINKVFPNFVHTMVESGEIHTDSIEGFVQFCDDIVNGNEGKTYTFKVLKGASDYCWAKVLFKTIRDLSGKPVKAVGVVEYQPNIERDMQVFEEEILFAENIGSSIMGHMRVNLSKEIIEKTSWSDGITINYDEYLHNENSERKYAMNHDEVINEIETSALLESYKKGRIWLSIVFRYLSGQERKPKWGEAAVKLIRHPISGDIYAFIFFIDVDIVKNWEIASGTTATYDGISMLYSFETMKDICNRIIADSPRENRAAATLFRFVGLDKVKEELGMQVAQKIVFSSAQMSRLIGMGGIVCGQYDENHLCFFRSEGVSSEQQRIRAVVLKKRLLDLLKKTYPNIEINISIGFALSENSEAASFEEMVRKAKIACDFGRDWLGHDGVAFSDIQDRFLPKTDKKDLKTRTFASGMPDRRAKSQAGIDPVTRLKNNVGFYKEVRESLEKNEKCKFMIMRFDVDNFKMINDRFGYESGDELLREIARTLNKLDDELEFISARLESDHFVIFMMYDKSAPKKVMERVSSDLENIPYGFVIALHMGVFVSEDHTQDISVMCDRAHLALKSIKRSYSEQIAYYSDDLGEKLKEEHELLTQMQEGLDRKQFMLYFQPQYNYATNELIGVECLIRWQHPTRGLIPPSIFLPLFESTGFIVNLDHYVWEEACKKVKSLRNAGIFDLPLSVNISRVDLNTIDVAKRLLDLLQKYNLPPSALKLEITESAYMDNPEILIAKTIELKRLGFVIEMDDFGSGYSSLNTLKDVPVDVLKLDMQFLLGAENENKQKNILESIVKMADMLGISVIAEGVEKKEQAEFLKSINCVLMQGYYFSKPIPEEAFDKLVKDKKGKKKR